MTPWSGGSSGSYARRYAATPGGGPLSADRPGSRAHGWTPGLPASRLQNRFAGGGGGLLHRPGSARSNLSTPSSASSHSSRRAPKPPQEPAHVALLRGSVNPKIVFGAPAKSAARGGARSKGGGGGREGAFYLTLVPIRPRWRGERRSLRTFPGVSLRSSLGFNPRPRRLSTPPDAFQLHPDNRSYGTTLSCPR
jgi:hypothetical protein